MEEESSNQALKHLHVSKRQISMLYVISMVAINTTWCNLSPVLGLHEIVKSILIILGIIIISWTLYQEMPIK